jgi:Putative adhesin
MSQVLATRGRIAAVAVGLPLLLVAVGQGVLNVTGLFARSSENHTASYAWGGGLIKLDSGDGNVTVQQGSSRSVAVAYTEHFGLKKPTVKGSVSGSGVELASKCSGIFSQYCSVNYTLTVPAGASLDLETGDGDVTLEGVSGDVTVRSGDGKIRGSELAAKQVTTSSGDGSVALQWSSAPQTVEVSMGDGSIDVAVPTGSGPYAVTHDMGDGRADISVANDPTAPRSIRLDMGDGSISVKYASGP